MERGESKGRGGVEIEAYPKSLIGVIYNLCQKSLEHQLINAQFLIKMVFLFMSND